jgi:hypothetical protein
MAARAEDERTDVHQGFTAVWRDPFRISRNSHFDTLKEVLLWDFRYRHIACGDGEAVCVGFWAVEQDVAVWSAVRFEAFVGLLAVVEGRGEAVDFDVGVLDEGGFTPFSGFYCVFGLDVAVDCEGLVRVSYRASSIDSYHCLGWRDRDDSSQWSQGVQVGRPY